MSSQIWRTVYTTLRWANRAIPRSGRRPRFPDTLIVAMCFWAVAWVRTLERVRRWVSAKTTIYHARLEQQALAP
jgi:hypothetical protein